MKLLSRRLAQADIIHFILILNVAVFAHSLLLSQNLAAAFRLTGNESPAAESVLLLGANVPLLVARGEVHRLLASCFLHGSFLHLALNAYWIWLLGRMVRDVLGNGRFLSLYVLAGFTGAVVSAFWRGRALLFGGELNDMMFMGLGVGASGAGMGIMGFLLAWLRGSEDMAAKSLRGQLLFWLGFNVIYGLANSHIDNAAHFGGLAMGFLFGTALSRSRHSMVGMVLASSRTTILAGALMTVGLLVGNLAPYLPQSDSFRNALALSPAVQEIVSLEENLGPGETWNNEEKRDLRHLRQSLANIRSSLPESTWSAVSEYADDLERASRRRRLDPEQHRQRRDAFQAYARELFLELAPCSGLMWKGDPRDLLNR